MGIAMLIWTVYFIFYIGIYVLMMQLLMQHGHRCMVLLNYSVYRLILGYKHFVHGRNATWEDSPAGRLLFISANCGIIQTPMFLPIHLHMRACYWMYSILNLLWLCQVGVQVTVCRTCQTFSN